MCVYAHTPASSIEAMENKRLHIQLNPALVKDLEALCRMLGLDYSNAIRYSIKRTLAAEKAGIPERAIPRK